MTAGPPSPPEPASPAPYPVNNEEQQALVRRRALPIAVASTLCGVGSLTLLLVSPVHLNGPPNLLAVQLSYCAILMGLGIIFYVRHTARTRAARAFCVLAILAGLAGTVTFAIQSVQFQHINETGEIAHITAIATAARQYAEAHGGDYPPDLATLLEDKRVSFAELHSPYETGSFQWPNPLPPHDQLRKLLEQHADYQYFGGGLRIVDSQGARAQSEFAHIVIAAKRYPIARKEISIAFGDGHAEFVGGDDWESSWKRSNNARRALGFPEARPPAASSTEP